MKTKKAKEDEFLKKLVKKGLRANLPPNKVHKDKNKYTRKLKHKEKEDNG